MKPWTRSEPRSTAKPLGTAWGTSDWGPYSIEQLQHPPDGDSVKHALDSLLHRAAQDLDRGVRVQALAAIHTEGVLPTAQAYKDSVAALASLQPVANWALCARVATGALAERCGNAARAGVMKWVTTYAAPSGDPIDENQLLPLLKSIDLLLPTMPTADQVAARAWLARLVAAEDRHHAEAVAHHRETATNNWESWRLAVRAQAETILGSSAELAATAAALHAQIAANLHNDGRSFDFERRDALRYHVYDVEALLESAAYAPRLLTAEDRAKLERAVEFLRPFFTGAKTHVEFVHSTVPFDIQRREAGIPGYANRDWDPANARKCLRLARALFPSIRNWTVSAAGDGFDPMTRTVSALHEVPEKGSQVQSLSLAPFSPRILGVSFSEYPKTSSLAVA